MSRAAWRMFILMPCHMCVWAGKVMYDTLVGTIYQLSDGVDVSLARTWFKFLSNLSTRLQFETWDENIWEKQMREDEWCKQTLRVANRIKSVNLINSSHAWFLSHSPGFLLWHLKFYFDLSRQRLMLKDLKVCFDGLIWLSSHLFLVVVNLFTFSLTRAKSYSHFILKVIFNSMSSRFAVLHSQEAGKQNYGICFINPQMKSAQLAVLQNIRWCQETEKLNQKLKV